MMWRLPALVPVTLLLALVSLAQVHAGVGLFGALWRATAVSWDNPSTQHVDELAAQSVPHTDPTRLARAHLLDVDGSHGSLALGLDLDLPPRPVLRSRLTRSPPAA